MLSFRRQSLKTSRQLHQQCGVRSVISNPALNLSPPFRNPAILPLGVNFVDDGLRACLVERGVDVDEVERVYYHQCQNDAELNNSRLPSSYESQLWGFIYGQKLVAAKYQLDTLRGDEEFLRNYLTQTVEELTRRMSRYYPSLDFKAQIAALGKKEAKQQRADDAAYLESYNSALAEIIGTDAERFVSGVFANNAFIPAGESGGSDEDKYGDYLPPAVESELIRNYAFEWDFNSNLTANFEAYFERMSRLENAVAPKVDSLSKNLRKNFADFLLTRFASNTLGDVQYVVDAIESATKCVVNSGGTKVESLQTQDLVQSCLGLLDEMASSSAIVSTLFFGGSSDKLANKSKDELVSVLSTVANQRLVLINKALQIYAYLKYNSMTRLFLSCLLNEYSEYFAQFLGEGGDDNLSRFEEANNDVLDEVVAFQASYYENQEDLVSSFTALLKSIQSVVGDQVNVSQALDLTRFEAPPCFVAAIFERYFKEAREDGNVLDEIKYLTYYNYVTRFASKIPGLQLALCLMNPARSGMDGAVLKSVAFQFATNASEANEVLFAQIVECMKGNALLGGDKVNTFKPELQAAVQNEVDNFRNVCTQFNNSRNNLEDSIQKLSLNFQNVNFDHAKSIYDPLNIHLAQFKYFDKR